jgi:Flp pilus assembly protein TadG
MTARRQDEDGSVAVELAIIAPILISFSFVCLQFALIFFAALSVITSARDITRYIAVNPNTTDSAATTAIKSRLPSDLDPAKLTLSVVPACATLTQNKCPNRAAGQDVAVSVSYDISNLFFLPHVFNFFGYTVQLPSQLPAYTMHMQAEPST